MGRVVEKWFELAKTARKRIVLPEAEDPRMLQAAREAVDSGLCNVELLGDPEKIRGIAAAEDVDLVNIPVSDPAKHPQLERFCEIYAELRSDGDKKVTPKAASRMITNPLFFAAMMVREGLADGVVAGAVNTTGNVVRAAQYVIGLLSGISSVSSVFVMEGNDPAFGENGTFIFADAGVIPHPTEDQLVEIAITSAATTRSLLGCEPRLAMLSFSTRGSASHERVNVVKRACEKVRQASPDLVIDGELQVDAAIIPGVAERKAAGSRLSGRANVLIFPDLDSGNIAYKLVERLAGYEAYGPFLQGLRLPMNDLSRGCKVSDIVRVMAVTALQACSSNVPQNR